MPHSTHTHSRHFMYFINVRVCAHCACQSPRYICRCSLTLILTHGTARFNSCVQSTILHKCTSIMCALCMPCHVTCLGIFVVCFPSTHTHSRHGQVQFLCAVDNIYINVRVLCALCMPCHLCMSSCFPSTIPRARFNSCAQ